MQNARIDGFGWRAMCRIRGSDMLDVLARNWWVPAVRGIAAILFGVIAFIWPGLTLFTLVILFAAYAIVDGASALVALVRGEADARRHVWHYAIIGVVGILAGIAAIVYPGITAIALLYVVAFWAFVIGVFQITAAIRLRREIKGELWMILGGIASVAFGALLVVFPGTGLLSLIWLVGLWAVMFGITNLALALRLRRHHQSVGGHGAMLGAH